MPQPVYFSPLGSDDARSIAQLQKKLFPPELTEPEEDIRQILRNTEQHMVCNLSFGLFHGSRMVGYAFAYVESESIFYKRDEEVIYIKEIALVPGYENWLRPLMLKGMTQCMTYCPNLAMEAHAQDDSLAKWTRLARLFRSLGITMTARDEARKEGRPPYKLIRFDFAGTTATLPEQPKALPERAWRFRDNITVSAVRDPRQWLSLKGGWDDLLQKTTDSNVFQSFEYLWQWWKHFGDWNELRVIVIRRGDSVIGVAPLMVEHFPIFGRVVRKLMFISAPMEMSRPKFIFGHDGDACLPALLAYLEDTADTWDVLDIDEQLLDETTGAVRAHFRKLRYLVAESGTVCPYIVIERPWDRFLSGLSRKMRSNINRLRRKLDSTGEIRVRKIDSWPALDAALDTHCEIEERSWKAEKQLHISGDKSHFFFYKALARSFGREGNFELRLLEYDGKPLASTFGIVRDTVFQSLKIAHDSDYDKLSPGTVLESYELEDLFQEDISRYEFMGSFLANKLRWTSTVCETTNIHVYQRQPRLMLFFFIFFVFKRRVKAVLKKTGQFDKVDGFLGRFKRNPFPRY
ncbi:MAG: GNAT family N-acetyltransferase [Woeseia sp.]